MHILHCTCTIKLKKCVANGFIKKFIQYFDKDIKNLNLLYLNTIKYLVKFKCVSRNEISSSIVESLECDTFA